MTRLVLLITAATMAASFGAWAQSPPAPSPSPPLQQSTPNTNPETTGGPLGTRSATPGTNASGTAIPPGTTTGMSPSGPADASTPTLGKGDPHVDWLDRQIDRKIRSICKGC